MPSPSLRVLSLGAGVQSSTLLLKAIRGEVAIDAAVFADTGWESTATYSHLAYLEGLAAEAGIPVRRVAGGDLRADALANKGQAWMPLFTRAPDGKMQQLKRQCTRNYKIRPIRRAIRALGGDTKHPVDQSIGISLDEWHRMKDSGVAFVRNVYPLVAAGVTRGGCMSWLTEQGFPIPPRSACLACPLKSDREWRDLKESDPAGWSDAVDFDTRIRAVRSSIGQEVYVHRTGLPLAEVDLSDARDHGQLDLFGQECEGVCGV